MNARFTSVPFAEIKGALCRHLGSLPSAIDSFLEDHIMASAHYRVEVADKPAGFASIHEERLIVQFALAEPYRRHGQALFRQLRRMEQVQSVFVPTCDEFFLSHALDEYRQLAKKAYFFTTAGEAPLAAPDRYTMRSTDLSDADLVRQESGDFFNHPERHIAAGELFVTLRGEEQVGFGLLIRSALYENVASIGMYTIERYRRDGVGTATISMLIEECRRRSLRPVAGCWYYNHRSRQTLERAGMFSATRLLKIDY